MCLIYKVERKTADLVSKALSKLLLPLKEIVYTSLQITEKSLLYMKKRLKPLAF
jgi:hypothetical protein